MKLRWGLIVLGILLMLVLPASAQTMNPGMITPQHGIFYQLEILWDDFVIFISPNKVMAKINVMNERLAEYEMTHDQRALNDYASKLDSLEDDLKQADQTTRQIVETHLTKHIEVLQEVKELVPEEAKPAIDKAIEESSKCKEALKHVSSTPTARKPAL
jgi:DNA-binding FrmR family transcriptional regulator